MPLRQRDPERLPPPRIAHEVPTPLEAIGERTPIRIDPVSPAARSRAFWTAGQLLKFFATRLRSKWSGQLDEERDAVLTRELFQRLGGMWVKVGQLLSLRSDMMSDAMCRELASLQHEQRGFPFETARQVIEEDLGKPISTVFSHFETQPFAAASIAQVHRATLLRNNRGVVVKVMRPDVIQGFAGDLRFLKGLVATFSFFGLFRRFRLSEGIVALSGVLNEETNYQYEAVNLKRMRKSLDDHGIYVPRVFSAFCGQRVLVMEEVPGVLMSQYIRMRREDPDRLNRWAALNGIEEKEVAERLSTSVLRQILEDNEFHGDLHPGNVMLLADNRIALIDFGSVGRLEKHAWLLYRHSLAALASRDYERAADSMLMLSGSNPMAKTQALRADMSAALRHWEFNSQIRSATYADRSVAAMSNAVARVMASHQLPLSWALMRVGRTLSTLDASLQTLVPKADFMRLSRVYFDDRRLRNGTLHGRMAALQAAFGECAAIAGDAQILLGPGLREQALRLHGVLGRAARVRIAVLSIINRGLSMLIAITIVAAVFDERFRENGQLNGTHAPIGGGDPIDPFINLTLSGIPDLHVLHWLLLLGLGLFISKLIRAAIENIAGHR